MPEFRLLRGGLQDAFLASRAKIQLYGGGFGNGKTTAMVVKALSITQDYPGCNGLFARSTYPKLNDTLRKEFINWCPKDWIKSFPISVNASNLCTLTNGSQLPFRYIAQQGKNEESSTSNLLSATYDFIVVDQIEDPEITFKDFLDLLGRLRGNTPYRGDDPTMPRTGPRWMLLAANPTRNWVFTELVEPVFQYLGHGKKGDSDYYPGGKITNQLLCMRDADRNPILGADGKPQLLIEIVEGPTTANAHNLPEDFITTQGSVYQGQMRARYLEGKWASYEGLVYPQWDSTLHMVDPTYMRKYLNKLRRDGYDIEWVEGYDYGLAAPSCYLLGFVDPHGSIIVVDGYYKAEYDLDEQYPEIRRIRREWGAPEGSIDADPDIFRRGKGQAIGSTIADLFWTDGNLLVRRAQNDIINGITKVSSYLNPRIGRTNPFTLETEGPSIYFSLNLVFVSSEMSGYFWKKSSTTGERIDEPNGTNDHALDTLKYMLTSRPDASKLSASASKKGVPAYMLWTEQDENDQVRTRRHG